MTPYRDDEDDDQDEEWDDEEADFGEDSAEDDAEDPADEPTVPCPSCRRMMFEDSPRCPSCGHYLTAEDEASREKARWVIVTAVVCLGVAIWWVFRAL